MRITPGLPATKTTGKVEFSLKPSYLSESTQQKGRDPAFLVALWRNLNPIISRWGRKSTTIAGGKGRHEFLMALAVEFATKVVKILGCFA
jgi:hypothetical protein